MSKWPMVPLGELLHKSNDWIPLRPDMTYQEVTVRLWGKGATLRRHATGAEIASAQRLRVRSGQFIISRIDARNGASATIPTTLDGAVVSSDFPVFSTDPTRLLPEFLDWFSKSKTFVALCASASEGTTNRVRLKEARFLTKRIPLPSLAEQNRLIQQINAVAAKLDEAKALRQDIGMESRALLKSAMRKAFQQIPEYEEVTLESVCTTIIDCLHSNPIYADTGVPTLRSPDVGWGHLMLDTALRTDETEYRRRTARGEPQAGDIIVVREGGGTGKAGLTEFGNKFSLGQRVMLLRPDPTKIEPRFLLYQWLSPLILDDQVVSRMKGSASPHLNIGAARRFRIRLPSLDSQRQVVSYLQGIRDTLGNLETHRRNVDLELDAMLPAILDRAFNGHLESQT
jgi:type I restriction enzyme S subunit